MDPSFSVFFALLRAGLWERPVCLASYGVIDWDEILRLSKEQTVVGLVGAGLEFVQDIEIPEDEAVAFAHRAMKIEERNKKLNEFLFKQAKDLSDAGVNVVLMKGQGVAQCYERPMWRSSGDIDWLVGKDYERAKEWLDNHANSKDEETVENLHVGYHFRGVIVELHGSFLAGLFPKMDRVLASIHREIFDSRSFREWKQGGSTVLLLNPDDDVVMLFAHILQHFYKGGIGLRQLCDWCRSLWTYRSSLDAGLLESRLQAMGVMDEWKTFAAMAVGCLGIPSDAMPLYDPSLRWKQKADWVWRYMCRVGNFGHNKDRAYQGEKSYFVRKTISFKLWIRDVSEYIRIFPRNTLRFYPRFLLASLRAVTRGE